MSVTLRKASQRTAKNPSFIKGRAEGMGISFEKVGPSLVMTETDFERLVEALKRDGYSIPDMPSAVA